MVKRKELKQTFSAVSASGRRVTVRVYVDIIDAGHTQDPDAEIEGMQSIRTSGGQHVNFVSPKKYQIVVTGETLTTDDPNAP
jgi:hypothetical protein